MAAGQPFHRRRNLHQFESDFLIQSDLSSLFRIVHSTASAHFMKLLVNIMQMNYYQTFRRSVARRTIANAKRIRTMESMRSARATSSRLLLNARQTIHVCAVRPA